MNFPEIVDIAPLAEGVFHNLVFVSIRKTCTMACVVREVHQFMHGVVEEIADAGCSHALSPFTFIRASHHSLRASAP